MNIQKKPALKSKLILCIALLLAVPCAFVAVPLVMEQRAENMDSMFTVEFMGSGRGCSHDSPFALRFRNGTLDTVAMANTQISATQPGRSTELLSDIASVLTFDGVIPAGGENLWCYDLDLPERFPSGAEDRVEVRVKHVFFLYEHETGKGGRMGHVGSPLTGSEPVIEKMPKTVNSPCRSQYVGGAEINGQEANCRSRSGTSTPDAYGNPTYVVPDDDCVRAGEKLMGSGLLSRAKQLFRIACDHGSIDGCYCLGEIYLVRDDAGNACGLFDQIRDKTRGKCDRKGAGKNPAFCAKAALAGKAFTELCSSGQ